VCRQCTKRLKGMLTPAASHKGEAISDPVSANESQMGLNEDTINPATQPSQSMTNTSHDLIGVNPANGSGLHAPPLDWDSTPITFARIATRWADIQLKNGLANGVASGRIFGYKGEGWYDNVVPVIPGQTRQYGGGLPANYPAKGGAPSQWDDHVNTTAGAQPDYPGGPGFISGQQIYNPGSGG
jgi:hypothetical protein